MMLPRSGAALLLAGLAAALPAGAQTVRGTVVDAATEAPVAGAVVTVLEGERRAGRAVSGTDGAFVLELRRPGVVRLRAERLGYAPVLSESVDVERREVVELRLPLSVEAVELQAVTVTARQPPPRVARLQSVGFYERERAGFGRFLRREDIERHRDQNLPQVLDRLPGAKLERTASGTFVVFDRSRSEGALSLGMTRDMRLIHSGPQNFCPPLVYLDGVSVAYTTTGLLDLVEPERIEAIEAYSGPSQTPAQWGGTGASCGVIVIWTRVQP